MLNYAKKILKKKLLGLRGICIDLKSDINWNVIIPEKIKGAKIVDSKLEIHKMGEGCFFEHVFSYGRIELGNYVSISGPGTVLHAVNGKIKIGNFVSIGQNVSINEFNHDMGKPSTYAMQLAFFSGNFANDVCSKGDIVIEDDVWIGSNSVICSGVHIGRGSIVAAGSVITKSVPPYTVVGGINKVLKKRFSNEIIEKLENLKWWKWNEQEIRLHKDFFNMNLCQKL